MTEKKFNVINVFFSSFRENFVHRNISERRKSLSQNCVKRDWETFAARFVSVFSNNYSFSFGSQTRPDCASLDVFSLYRFCVNNQELIFRDFNAIFEDVIEKVLAREYCWEKKSFKNVFSSEITLISETERLFQLRRLIDESVSKN